MILSFLQRIQGAPLTEPQKSAAIAIGRGVGVGYDDPAFDDPPEASEAPPVHTDPRPLGGSRALRPQPWGPLPLRPPGR